MEYTTICVHIIDEIQVEKNLKKDIKKMLTIKNLSDTIIKSRVKTTTKQIKNLEN